MKRRDFIRASLACAVGVSLPALAATGEDHDESLDRVRSGFPCLQVFTDNESAQFRIVRLVSDKIRYAARDPNGMEVAFNILSSTANPHLPVQVIDHLIVTGLAPHIKYTIFIYHSETGVLLDQRGFSALDIGGVKCRFALISCMLDFVQLDADAMWRALEASAPEVIFFIGDACYADVGSGGKAAGLWERHFQTRHRLEIYWWKNLIPVLSTWDDHDYGTNNGDRTNPLRDDAYQAFNAYFGSAPRPSYIKGPGVAHVAKLFGHRFCLMDDRFFRDPLGTPNGLHWGQEQESWILNEIATGDEPVWLLNGNQYFGGYSKNESFERCHPFQFKRLMQELRAIEAPVILGSGDVHFSELMRIENAQLGYETFEITSSSMHCMTFPGMQLRDKNPRRIASTWHHNFILIESDASLAGRLAVDLACVGAKNKNYFSHSLQVVRR